MATKEYNLNIYKRNARPRSKRLRESGMGGTGNGGSTVVNVGGGGNASSAASHTHANKSVLDQISADAEGYMYLEQLREVEDEEGNKSMERVPEKIKAGYADKAHDLDEDSPVNDRFLSALADDIAEGNITFKKTITVIGAALLKFGAKFGNYAAGATGANIDKEGNAELHSLLLRTDWQSKGFAAGMTGAGVGTVNGSELHADKLLARKYIEVLSLVVSQMFWRGGRQVLSPAGLKVSRVEAVAGGWRLYMETEDGQKNEFTVGAQARCNNYGTSQRYWWRLVTAVGADYIEVSETDCDAGSVVPAVCDEVVQFGHRTDPHQQWAVMDSSFSDDAGRTIYAGIDSYDLSGKLVLREGVDPNDPGRIGLFLADGTEVSTAIGNLQDEIGGLGEGLRMDIVAEEGNLVVDGAYDGDLVATVWRRWNDITSTVSGWVWTRQSGTDSASLASDALWNEAHAGVKSGRINITGADIVTDTVKFVCDATVGTQTVRGIFYGQ